MIGVCVKKLEATQFFVDFFKAFDSVDRAKMEQILPANGLLKSKAALQKKKAMAHSSDGNTDSFDTITGSSKKIQSYQICW